MSLVERLDDPSTYRFEQVVPRGKIKIECALRRARFAHDILNPHIRATLFEQPFGCFDDFQPSDLRVQATTSDCAHNPCLLTSSQYIMPPGYYQAAQGKLCFS